MGEFYASPEDAVRDFIAVLEVGTRQKALPNQGPAVSTRELVEEAFRFFHALQRGSAPENESDYRRITDTRRRYMRKKVAERKAKGLCVKCGEREAEPGRDLCFECLRQKREYDKKREGAVAYKKKEKGAMACMNS